MSDVEPLREDRASKPRIVCIGNIAIDHLLYVDSLPDLDEVAVVRDRRTCLGGRGALAALILGALGCDVSLCTVVGGGIPEKWIAFLREYSVDISTLTIEHNHTSVNESYVLIGKSEQNCISAFMGYPIHSLPTPIQEQTSTNADYLYLSTHDKRFNSHILRLAQSTVQQIVHSLSGQLLRDRSYAILVSERSTVLVGNERDTAKFLATLNVTVDSLFRERNQLRALFMTQGAAGVQVYERGEPPRSIEVKPVPVVTPVGIGDAFSAGMVYGLASGLNPLGAARTGIALATESLRAPTTHPDLAGLRERIQGFL